MPWLRELCLNPFFRRGLVQIRGARWPALLVAGNAVYVAAFLAAYVLETHQPGLAGARITRDFPYDRWLSAGLLLLSVNAHWLVPPLLLRSLPREYDLDTLNVMVRERRGSEDVLRGQVAAGVAPLYLGVVPLAAGALLLLLYGPAYALSAGGAVCGALLWLALCTAVSAWVGAGHRPARDAALQAYVWTCVVLPAVIGVVALAVAHGCCADLLPPRRQMIFNAAAAITWGVLVTGCAAAFWDLAQRRYFPERRRSLWLDPGPDAGARAEG